MGSLCGARGRQGSAWGRGLFCKSKVKAGEVEEGVWDLSALPPQPGQEVGLVAPGPQALRLPFPISLGSCQPAGGGRRGPLDLSLAFLFSQLLTWEHLPGLVPALVTLPLHSSVTCLFSLFFPLVVFFCLSLSLPFLFCPSGFICLFFFPLSF